MYAKNLKKISFEKKKMAPFVHYNNCNYFFFKLHIFCRSIHTVQGEVVADWLWYCNISC